MIKITTLTRIRDNLHAGYREGDIWELIPSQWFDNWKRLVCFDCLDLFDENVSQPVPPIDNSGLCGQTCEDVRRDAKENIDYSLIPKHVADIFASIYGINIRFPRVVVNMGSDYNVTLRVQVFPIRVEYFICNRENPSPIGNPFVRYFQNAHSLERVVMDITSDSGLVPVHGKVRYWVNGARNCGLMHQYHHHHQRALTLEAISHCADGWMLSSNGFVMVEDLQDSKGVVHLLLEVFVPDSLPTGYFNAEYSVDYIPLWEDWPRYSCIGDWRNRIAPGDVVDAYCSSMMKWLEALVLAVDEEKFLIHFKTLDDSNDAEILRSNASRTIFPLFEKSANWRYSLEEEDWVDIRVYPTEDSMIISHHGIDNGNDERMENGYWIQGVIDEVLEDGEISVVFDCSYLSFIQSEEYRNYVTNQCDNSSLGSFSRESIGIEDELEDALQGLTEEEIAYYNVELIHVKKGKKTLSSNRLKLQAESDDNSKSKSKKDDNNRDGSPKKNKDWRKYAFSAYQQKQEFPVLKKRFDLFEEDVCAILTHTFPTIQSDSFMKFKYNPLAGRNLSSYDYGDRDVVGKPEHAGGVGLCNLGNTSYFNSILQCLAHASPLKELFLSGRYRYQINRHNEESMINSDLSPAKDKMRSELGSGGRLAKCFGQLIRQIWSQRYQILAPRKLKMLIGKYLALFSGFEQQDAHELLIYLLEGLHQDLKVVPLKGFSSPTHHESHASSSLPQPSQARSFSFVERSPSEEAWKSFLHDRNRSEMVDMFYGQLRGSILCSHCHGSLSSQYHPFNCLSLPIPSLQSTLLNVLVKLLPLETAWIEMEVLLPSEAPVLEVMKATVKRLMDLQILLSEPPEESPEATTTNICHREDKGSSFQYRNHYWNLCLCVGDSKKFINLLGSESLQCYDPFCHTFVLLEMEEDVSPCLLSERSGTYRPPSIRSSFVTHGPTMSDRVSLSSPSSSLSSSIASYRVIDIYVGASLVNNVFSELRSGSFFHNLDYPSRIVWYNDMTFDNLHELVFLIASRYFPSEDIVHSFQSLPYELFYGNHLGTVTYGKIPKGTNAFTMEYQESVVIRWLNSCYNEEHFVCPPHEIYSLHGGKNTSSTNVGDRKSEQCPHHLPRNKGMECPREASTSKSMGISLATCLTSFASQSPLEGFSTSITCPHCATVVGGEDQSNVPLYQLTVWKPPLILIIQLKRFYFGHGFYSMVREKITDPVIYPLEGLSLREICSVKDAEDDTTMKTTKEKDQEEQGIPLCDMEKMNESEDAMYDLFAVCCHIGTLISGQYFSLCKSESGKWLTIKDSNVAMVDETEVVNPHAYLLFYIRR